MLSEKTIEIVKSTAPVLEVKGKEITTYFYKTLFENHPELLNVFNHANQKKGRQQTALANTVYAAAQHIDRLHVLLPAVKQIAHKHRSLGIKPEHYPIVGEHLLQAIKAVLQEAATDEILEAWGEAYGVIAKVFIDVEEDMYADAEAKDGGFRDFKEFVVVNKEVESDVITSFYLKPKDGTKVPPFLPGQYITIRLAIPGEEYLFNRQYSLSTSPKRDYYRISVKRESDSTPEGKVSNYLHTSIEEGDGLEVSAPAGDFYLEPQEDKPVVLISGGVGITPMMSMLEALVDTKSTKEVSFIHASRNHRLHAFYDEAVDMTHRLENGTCCYIYENEESSIEYHYEGFITKEILEQYVKQESVCYICGPVQFMKAIVQHLTELGLPQEQIKYEFFGPAMHFQQVEQVNN